MSTPKFTPGPWTLEGVNGRYAYIRGEWDICRIEMVSKQSEANAALIAAAPDMHAALTVIIRRLESGQIEQLRDPSEITYLKELLAKAEGR